MRAVIFFIALCFVSAVSAQNIPKTGTDTTVDVVCWNTEWLGDAQNGPSNEVTQMKNVVAVIKGMDMDLWGMCEVSSPAAWDTLKARLPEYDGVISTWSQTQKTALLYRKSLFRVLNAQHILAVYEREFASGRLPLEVMLEVSSGIKKDTMYAIVLHLKANTGTTAEKAESYDFRKRSSEALKEYMDARKSRKFLVIGDWNDDLDVSIYNNLATPFARILSDTSQYYFPSRALTLSGQRSTVSFSNMIDHQMINRSMRPYFVAGSAAVFRADAYISGYGSNTSDHYPVTTRYDFRRTPPALGVKMIRKPWYFDGKGWRFEGGVKPKLCRIYQTDGRLLYSGEPIMPHVFPAGLYVLELQDTENRIYRGFWFHAVR